MRPYKARVRNGRIVVDEPTSLPDGEEFYVVSLDNDGFAPEEQAALQESLRESLEQMHRGQLFDADVALAKLRAGQ